jgi:hypothetical protein
MSYAIRQVGNTRFVKTQEQQEIPDHLYYNIKISNNTDTEIPAQYQETRTSPIINDNLCKYEVAVARFKIPNNIPIFVFQPNTYFVNLVDSAGNDHPTACQWIINNTNPSTLNFVYEYNEWAQSVTNALLASYNAIPVLLRPDHPPFVLYDPNQTKFSLYATSNYAPLGGTFIYMNAPCFNKFSSWNATYGTVGTNRYANVLIQQLGNNLIVAGATSYLNTLPAVNGVTYYQIEQSINSLFLLSDFDSLLLRTSNLPIYHELYSEQKQSNDGFVSIMTDFEPIQDNTFNDKSYFQYNPAVYRWASLYGAESLRKMDLLIFFRTVNGGIYPVSLFYGDEVSVKLAFKKKSHLVHSHEI